jgi:hypothetical protein
MGLDCFGLVFEHPTFETLFNYVLAAGYGWLVAQPS